MILTRRKITLNFIIQHLPKLKEVPVDIMVDIVKLLQYEGKEWAYQEICKLKKEKRQLFYILLLQKMYAKIALIPIVTDKGKKELIRLFNELKILSFVITAENYKKKESMFWQELTESTYRNLLIEITKILKVLGNCKLANKKLSVDTYLRDLDYSIICIEDSLATENYKTVSEIATFYKTELGRTYVVTNDI